MRLPGALHIAGAGMSENRLAGICQRKKARSSRRRVSASARGTGFFVLLFPLQANGKPAGQGQP